MEFVIESTKPIQAVVRIRIGETFFPTLVWRDSITKQPISWTGYDARCELIFSDTDIIVLDTATSGIVLGTNGDMQLFISDTDTALLTKKNGTFKLIITDSLLHKSTWVEGVARII
jgi:hypothetical protein